jgi:hypothetical protein
MLFDDKGKFKRVIKRSKSEFKQVIKWNMDFCRLQNKQVI